MTLWELVQYIYSIGGDNETKLWICDNDGCYSLLTQNKIEKDLDNSVNIHTGIY